MRVFVYACVRERERDQTQTLLQTGVCYHPAGNGMARLKENEREGAGSGGGWRGMEGDGGGWTEEEKEENKQARDRLG